MRCFSNGDVELDVPGHKGAPLFEWFPDSALHPLYNGLGAWLNQVTSPVRASACIRAVDADGPYVAVEDYEGPLAAASIRTPPHRVYG